MSVDTENHNLFHVNWKGNNEVTLEPKCHLRNSHHHLNNAIDAYNKNGKINVYKGKKA